MPSRSYEYPTVTEITQRGAAEADDFHRFPEFEVKNSAHFESLANHYDEQYGSAMLNLGRALMKESGQLTLEFEDAEKPYSTHVDNGPKGPPAEIPEVKKCEHAECDCD